MPDEPVSPETPQPPSDKALRPGFLELSSKFIGGCFLTLALGAGMFVAFFDNMHRAMGCAAVQLVYVIPAVFFLLRKRQPAWAFGIVFGGAIVLLMASICGDMGNMH